MAEEDSLLDDASDKADVNKILSASAAFHRWQKARLKASFKKQLSDILEDVTSEEKVTRKLRQQLRAARAREDELLQRLSAVEAELKCTAAQTSQQRADIQELTTALEALEAHAAALQQQATDAEVAHSAEIDRSITLQVQQQQELKSAKHEQQELLKQQHTLLESLAQRDQQVARYAADLKVTKATATDAAQQLQRLEGVLQATGERAAAAEDGLRTTNQLVVSLQQQLAELKDRYYTELAGLSSLRAAAAESAALKDRLAQASAAAAGLAAARDEMNSRLDAATAALAAASEQKRLLEHAAHIEQALQEAGLAGDLVGVLSQQLEDAQSQVTALSPKLAAAEAAVQQQQRHIQQLAADLQQAKGARSAAAERGEVLQVLNVQLQAEVTRLAALAGVHLRDWAGQAGATAADTAMNEQSDSSNAQKAHVSAALLMSQLQECLDSLEATKRSMMRSRPKVTAAATQATAASALVTQAATLLQQVIATLRPDQQQQKEPVVLAAVVHSTEQQLTAALGKQAAERKGVLEDLQLQMQQEQQHWQQVLLVATTAETALQEVATVVSSVCGGELSGAAVSGSVIDALQGAAQQLSSIEQQLASALEYDSSCWLGEEACVMADVAARDICTLLLELSALLDSIAHLAAAPAAEVSDESETVGSVINTVSYKLEVAAARVADKLKVIRSCCVSVSSSLAELSSVTAYLHTAQQQAAAAANKLQQLQQLLQEQQQSHSNAAAPAAANNIIGRKLAGHGRTAGGVGSSEAEAEAVAELQLEVAALRLQLQRREGEVNQLMAREKQLLSGTSDLVPSELLAAAGRHQDELTQHITTLQQQLVQQAAAQQYAAGAYVERVAAKLNASRLVEAWLGWRIAAAEGRAGRLCIELCEAQAALQDSAQLQQLRFSALAALLKRQCKAAAAEQQQQLEAAVIAAWQRQAKRQVHATWLWRGLSELLLQQTSLNAWTQQQQHQQDTFRRKHQQLGNTASSILPHQHNHQQNCPSSPYSSKGACLAAVLLQRKHHPEGSCVWSVGAGQLLSLVFSAWRSWAHLEGSTRVVQQKLAYVDHLSSSLPAWVQQLGDKRRLERGWLAWRLAAARKPQQVVVAAAVADVRQSEQAAIRSTAVSAAAAAEGGQNDVRSLAFGGQPSWQVVQEPGTAAHSLDLNVSTAPTSSRDDAQPPTATAGKVIGVSSSGIAGTLKSVEVQQQQQQASSNSQQRLQQRLLSAGVDLPHGTGRWDVQHVSASQQGAVNVPAYDNLQQKPFAVPLSMQQQQQQEQTERNAGMPLQTARQQAMNKQQQRLSLRSKTNNGRNIAASVKVSRSPPAGLRVKAAGRNTTGTTSPPLQVPRPRLTSPGAAAAGKAAFGRTLKAGDWAPAAAPGVNNSGPSGKVGVAGLAEQIGAGRFKSAASWAAAGSHKQQQQQGDWAQQEPAETTTEVDGAPVASSVHDHLAAISSSLTTLQQQVQLRSRALFQAGADALHPGVVTTEAAHQQPLYQQQQLSSEVIVLHSKQPGSTAGLVAGQQPRQQHADDGDSAANTAMGGTSRSTGAVSDLQQQLIGCQQHLQQLTSSLRIASRPWLHTADATPSAAAAGSAGTSCADGDQTTHLDGLQPTSAVSVNNGGPLKQLSVAAAAAKANLGGASSSIRTLGLESAGAAGQAASRGASRVSQIEGPSIDSLMHVTTSTAGVDSSAAVASTGGSEGVDVVALLTSAVAAATATGQQEEVRLTSDRAAATVTGIERQRSPAVVVDTRSPQVTAGETHQQAAAGCSPRQGRSPVAGMTVLSEWHVMGQPRKTLVQSIAAAATKGPSTATGSTAGHALSVPLSTYVTSHSSTPGPGNHTPPRPQLHGPGAPAQIPTAPTNATGADAGAKPLPFVASSSPIPAIASTIPKPYISAASLKQAHPQPAVQLDTSQMHTAVAGQLNSDNQAAISELELQQGIDVAGSTASAVAFLEPGVVRFERVGRSGTDKCSAAARQLQ